MPVVTSNLLTSMTRGVRILFQDEFAAAQKMSPWRQLVMMGDARGKESVNYSWLSSVPKMTRWRGQLDVQGLEREEFLIHNHLWVDAISVDRLALERDQAGEIPSRTRQLAAEAERNPGEQVLDLLVANTTDTFDGDNFFSDTREIGKSGVIDNIMAASDYSDGGSTAAAAWRLDFFAARARMARFCDDKGRPMNSPGNLVLAPPDLEPVIWEGLNTGAGAEIPAVPPISDGGITSWTARGVTAVFAADLADTAEWFLFRATRNVAPLIYQEEFAPQVEAVTNPESDLGLIYEKFVWKVRHSFGVGYSDPRLAIKIT